MSSSFVIDSTLQAAKTALDGLSQRQNVISRNMANIDTPGYQAQTVNFESALKKAMTTTPQISMSETNPAHLSGNSTSTTLPITVANRLGGSERADGNNVDLDVELTDMAETGVSYQAMTTAINKKLDLLKTIASR